MSCGNKWFLNFELWIPEEQLSELKCQFPCHVLLSIHHTCNLFCVFDQHRQLAVTASQHASVVDVGRADDDQSVVDDHELAVDVDELGDQVAAQHVVGAQPIEADVLLSLWDCKGIETFLRRYMKWHVWDYWLYWSSVRQANCSNVVSCS